MRFFIFICLVLFNFTSIYALTIQEAVNEALKNNRTLKVKNFEYHALSDKYKAAKSLQMPSFFTESSLTLLNKDKKIDFSTPIGSQSITLTEKDYIEFTTGIKLNLYTGGLISGNISKTFFEKEASEKELEENRLTVIYNTKIAYINILELEAFEKIFEEHLLSLKKHYSDVENLYNQGMVPYIDLLETEVKLKDAMQNLTSVRNSINVAKSNLSVILGRTLSDNITVKSIDKLQIKNFNEKRLYKIARQNRPVIKMITNKIKAANSEINMAASGYKPKVYVLGGYTYSDMSDHIENKGNFLLQAGIKFQIDWDKSLNEINAAKNAKYALLHKKDDILSRIMLGVKKAYEEFNTSKANLDVAKAVVKSAKEYYRTIKLKYSEGLTDNSHVLDAEAMLTKALMTEKTHYFDIMKKYFLLERVTGKDKI